jgi:hypothetical protein
LAVTQGRLEATSFWTEFSHGERMLAGTGLRFAGLSG